MKKRCAAALGSLALLAIVLGSFCLVRPEVAKRKSNLVDGARGVVTVGATGGKTASGRALLEKGLRPEQPRKSVLEGAGDGRKGVLAAFAGRVSGPEPAPQELFAITSALYGQRGATPRRPLDRALPWSWPGQCIDQATTTQRADYLRTFDRRNVDGVAVHVAPGVADAELSALASLLPNTHLFATRALDAEAPVAEIFLHATASEMRKHACVASTAVAYYDGAIHIAALGSKRELKTSLEHEYAHHVLSTLGVGKPVWFQEGFAMRFAGDQPAGHYATWREAKIDLDKMVEPLPLGSSEREVNAYYSNAATMYEFLERLCLGRKGCGPGQLASALTNEDTFPRELFLWATERRADDLARSGPLRFWQDYEQRGRFAPETLKQLLARARQKR